MTDLPLRELAPQVAALREVATQLLEAARPPDANLASSAAAAARALTAEATPRSFPGPDGGTLYQLFTELDSTQTGASAL